MKKPVITNVSRDTAEIKKAIAQGERPRFKKPASMALKEMINEGRA